MRSLFQLDPRSSSPNTPELKRIARSGWISLWIGFVACLILLAAMLAGFDAVFWVAFAVVVATQLALWAFIRPAYLRAIPSENGELEAEEV